MVGPPTGVSVLAGMCLPSGRTRRGSGRRLGRAQPRDPRRRVHRTRDRSRPSRANGDGRAASGGDCRILGRRDHWQDPRRHHHGLESWRRTPLWLHRCRGHRAAHLNPHARGSTQRAAGDHGATHARRVHRKLQDGARRQRPPTAQRLGHHFTDQERGRPHRRRIGHCSGCLGAPGDRARARGIAGARAAGPRR
jgi:hypothetical protein